MAKLLCKCGNTLSDSYVPSEVRYHVYSDEEFHKILENDVIETLSIPEPKYDVWKCPNCQRVYIFSEGGSVIRTYKIEE
jgi:hypothetical protein